MDTLHCSTAQHATYDCSTCHPRTAQHYNYTIKYYHNSSISASQRCRLHIFSNRVSAQSQVAAAAVSDASDSYVCNHAKCNCIHCRARKLVDGSKFMGRRPGMFEIVKGLRPADRDFEAERGGVSTDSRAKMHLPAPGGPLGDSWSKLAKALPPAGRNLQGELGSPDTLSPHLMRSM
jgi:hypothetical protein